MEFRYNPVPPEMTGSLPLERMSSIPPFANNAALIEKLKMEAEADA